MQTLANLDGDEPICVCAACGALSIPFVCSEQCDRALSARWDRADKAAAWAYGDDFEVE